jgi:hypothetical protein
VLSPPLYIKLYIHDEHETWSEPIIPAATKTSTLTFSQYQIKIPAQLLQQMILFHRAASLPAFGLAQGKLRNKNNSKIK